MKKFLITIPVWAWFVILFAPFLVANNIPYGELTAVCIWLMWLYLVGHSVHDKASLIKPVSLRWFDSALLYSLGYFLVIEFVHVGSLKKYLFILPLLCLGCIIGVLFFVSKLVVMSEEKKTVKANRCFGTFLLFWFFPVGVWFLHPRIKKILKE